MIDDLWNRIAAGDQDAVAIFCDYYRPRLVFLCSKRGVPQEDSRDIAQDIVATAVCQMSDRAFLEQSSLNTWVMGIFRNKLADYWRKHKRQVACVSFSTDIPRDVARLENLQVISPHPDLSMVVKQALAQLPDEHRLLLLLNTIEGYTAKEIAPLVGRSEGRVGALIAEAKSMFRIAMLGSDEDSRETRQVSGGE